MAKRDLSNIGDTDKPSYIVLRQIMELGYHVRMEPGRAMATKGEEPDAEEVHICAFSEKTEETQYRAICAVARSVGIDLEYP